MRAAEQCMQSLTLVMRKLRPRGHAVTCPWVLSEVMAADAQALTPDSRTRLSSPLKMPVESPRDLMESTKIVLRRVCNLMEEGADAIMLEIIRINCMLRKV